MGYYAVIVDSFKSNKIYYCSDNLDLCEFGAGGNYIFETIEEAKKVFYMFIGMHRDNIFINWLKLICFNGWSYTELEKVNIHDF